MAKCKEKPRKTPGGSAVTTMPAAVGQFPIQRAPSENEVVREAPDARGGLGAVGAAVAHPTGRAGQSWALFLRYSTLTSAAPWSRRMTAAVLGESR